MARERSQLLTERQLARVKAAAERNPDSIRPRLRLALHYWRNGELNEALEWVDRGLALHPADIGAYRIRANVLVEMSRTAKAVETAMAARAVAPQSIPAHILIVRMLLADLQPGRAQEFLDAAVDLDPDPAQLRQLTALQKQILAVSQSAERKPLDWIARKFNRRRANVAGEDPESQ